MQRRRGISISRTLVHGLVLVPALLFSQEKSQEKAGPAPQKSAGGEQGKQRPRPARSSPDLVNRASEELLEVQRGTRSLEVEGLKRRKAAEERLRELAAERKSLERALEALQRDVEGREKELSQKKETLSTREKEAAQLQREAGALGESLKQFIQGAEKQVETGIAWKTDSRKAALSRARDGLSASTPDLRDTLALVGRFALPPGGRSPRR